MKYIKWNCSCSPNLAPVDNSRVPMVPRSTKGENQGEILVSFSRVTISWFVFNAKGAKIQLHVGILWLSLSQLNN